MEQLGAASDRSVVNQAARDLYVNALPGTSPGLASLAVPEEVTHTVRGRSELVADLSAAVEQGGRIVVLHGNGGHGKTTLAVQFAHYTSVEVWWVDASSSTGLVEGLREVALRAGADGRAVKDAWTGASSAPEVLWSALDNRTRPWLLVLDNADDPAALSPGGRGAVGRGWLRTPKSTGTVLVTSRDSRRSAWGDRAVLLPVDVLGVEDAAAMLLELAPAAGDGSGARELAERLGGLPLALRLAGHYLRSTSGAVRLPGAVQPTTFAEYDSALADHPDADDREALSRTWELSLDLLAKRGRPRTRPLMRLLSVFAQAPVPVELLDAAVLASSDRFRGITPQELSVLVEDLRDLGLVEHREDALVLHPLVREANLRQAAGYGALRTDLLVRLVERLSLHDHSMWPLWRKLLPHCAEIDAGESEAVYVNTKTGVFFLGAGLLVEAEALLRRAVDGSVDLLGENREETISLRDVLAIVLWLVGRRDAALIELRTVLAWREQSLGTDHEITRRTRVDLAELASGQVPGASGRTERPERAEAELRELLKSQQVASGEHHIDVLMTVLNLVGVLVSENRLDEAEQELRRTVSSMERAMGRNGPLTTSVRDLLEEITDLRRATPPR